MNGKIKTKFAALFAVALMITVCVVPMVGGSEDVEAATTETVTISGNVYAADGKTGLEGVKVYYGDTIGKYNFDETDDKGKFEFKGVYEVPVGNIVLKVDASDTVYEDYVFPITTLGNVQQDKESISIVAGTVPIAGQMKLKDGSELKVEGISVSVGNKTVKTDDNGKFTFYVTPGNEYNVTASFANVTFSGKAVAVADPEENDNKVDIVASSNMLVAVVSMPTGTLSTAASASGTAAASFGTPTFITSLNASNEIVYTLYSSISYNSGTTVSVDATMHFGYGISDVLVEGIVDANATSGDITNKTFTASDMVTGEILVGDVSVNADVVLSSTATSGDDKGEDIEAFVKDGTFFVGKVYEYDDDDPDKNKEIDKFEITAEYEGYVFNKLKSSDDFEALNAAKIIVNVTDAPEDSQFTVDADNAVVDKDGYVASDNTGFEFFVPIGTEVIITAPANFAPASEKIVKAYGDTTISFTYNAEVVYKGQVLLNGVPISLAVNDIYFSTDGGRTFSNGNEVKWPTPVDEPYYTLTLPRTTDASDVMIKLKLNSEKASDYLFEENKDDENYTAAVGVTGTTIGSFNVKAQDQTVTFKDKGTTTLNGMEVTFYMLKNVNNGFDEDLIVKELGKTVTDVEGEAKIQAATPVSGDGYTIWAVPSGVADAGTYTFSAEAYAAGATYSANENTYSGYYTANGSALPGFGMSYVAVNSTDKIMYFGDATIIDNKYYIVGQSGYTLNLTLKDGFSFEKNNVKKEYSITGSEDLVVYSYVNVETFDIKNMTTSEYSGFVTISEDVEAEKGTVIVLSAEKTCYKLQDVSLDYKFSDSAVEYKFAGWYVNGKLLTEECDAVFTLTEDVVIVAQYDEAVKVIGSQDVPEAGLDTNVLILGIVVVVIALIAVVYSVISKRD